MGKVDKSELFGMTRGNGQWFVCLFMFVFLNNRFLFTPWPVAGDRERTDGAWPNGRWLEYMDVVFSFFR